ncbi:MAG: agmatinase [Armatimonadota bacterium]
MIQPPSPYPFLASKPGVTGRVTLLGAPLDRTGSFRPGAAEGPVGIRWASENLETYSPQLDLDLEDMTVGDLGDLDFTDLSQETALARIEEEVGALLQAGTLPFVFGGEHTISLGVARAVLRAYPDALIVVFDAHADLRDTYLDEPLSHATWAYRVGEEFGFDRLVQLGIRSGLREEFQLGRERCAWFSMDLETPQQLLELLNRHPLYISLDIDVLDPSAAPGTGTPEAGGASYQELHACLQRLAGCHVVAMDINEVAPPLDPTGATAATAAKLAREMILLFGK